MKLPNKLKLAAIFTGAIALGTPLLPALAQFTEEPMAKEQVVAVAVPAGAIGYNLAVVEQIPGKQQCWAENGSNPTVIDPLWTTFDFTGSCRRSTDSNGYSVRMDGQDTSLDYRLDVVSKGDQLELVAKGYQGGADLVVGQTSGIAGDGDYLKINLNPGWEFTKKGFEGKLLGHFFFSGDSTAIATTGDAPAPVPTASADFSDIARDIYQDEIRQAVALGFIAGFKDKTFRPTESLTREQLVSMVYGALETIDSVNLSPASSVPTQPYPDVESTRWSASKIQWAKENEIVKGYPDGTFKPGTPVTRAELIAVLNNVAKFANLKQGQTAELVTNQEPTNFSDTANHWGATTIQTMSAYCGVASPAQEVGDVFAPDTPAQRDYAAAATLRTHDCLTGNSGDNNQS
ncbi:MAG: DUF3747 domain-containing protein [Cyanobacteria bacterium P01_E01_bin.35]